MLVQAEQQQQMMVIKGKRTKRARPASPLPPLITMSTSSSSGVDETARLATSSSSTTTTTNNNLESGSHHLYNSSPSPTYTTTTQEEEDMAYCLILLAQGGAKFQNYPSSHQENSAAVYECKTCNRGFPSFQALGGHRASHKKPKASPQEPEHHQSGQSDKFTSFQGMGLSLQMACNSSNTLSAINFNSSDNSTKLKVHACGICGAEFSSGQALGGHMRRHRTLIAAVSSTPATQSAAAHEPPRSVQFCLDLNLPAEDEQEEAETPKFVFGSSDKTMVFTAGSLVDCRY